jgi:hypothetical protein
MAGIDGTSAAPPTRDMVGLADEEDIEHFITAEASGPRPCVGHSSLAFPARGLAQVSPALR